MSVLIKGMEMPKGCAFCRIPMRNGKKMNCPLVRCEWDLRDPMSADHRLEGCPLVELPPHGRLIDADELAKEIQSLQKYRFSIEDPEIFVSRGAVMQAIKDEHAIIEADEEQTPVCSAIDCEHNVGGVCKKNAEEVGE